MSFMEPEIYVGEYWQLETNNGIWFVPCELTSALGLNEGDRIEFANPRVTPFADYVEGGKVNSAELCSGVLGRLSAPGYMDCTDWSPYATEEDALEELAEDDTTCE